MSRPDLRRSSRLGARFGLAAAVGLAAAFGPAAAPVAFADPAATPESAWSPLPATAAPGTGSPLERRGREVFEQRCAACHGAIPAETFGPPFLPPMPGTQALAARYQGALPARLEERSDLTADQVRTVVREGFVSMPFFRPTELSNEDLDALAAYLTGNRSAASASNQQQ